MATVSAKKLAKRAGAAKYLAVTKLKSAGRKRRAHKSSPSFVVGVVGHFGLAVLDPKKSARWFERALGFERQFEYEDGVAVGNDHVTIALHKGRPGPQVIGHMSFHLPNMTALRNALWHLKKHKVEVEDPGDEIGPESSDSPHMGIWFYDPDGYRWELNVPGGS